MLEHRMMPTAVRLTNSRTLEGIAVPYNSLSVTLRDRPRPYKERIEPRSIQWDDNVVMLMQHDPQTVPLARVGAGTMRVFDSSDGLRFEADLPENRADVIEALSRGDLDGSVSIGFVCREDSWQHHRGAPSVRTVRAATLHEISIVSAGAYRGARGSLKES